MAGPRGPGGPALPRSGIGGNEAAVPAPAPATATSNFPELHIEWMPDGKPSDVDGAWETLIVAPEAVAEPGGVSEGSTKRGRQYVLDRFVAGVAPLTLKTKTRIYDPENAAGPYYGKLRPMKQLRITATWAGVTHPVWRGYITSWGTTARDDKLFVTTLATKDGFERLERFRLPSSAWALEVQKDNPTCWLRLGERDTTRLTDSSPGGNYGVYDNCTQGATGLVVNDADGAIDTTHSDHERAIIQNPNIITGYPFTLSAMIRAEPLPAETRIVFSAFNSSTTSNGSIWFYIPSGGGQLALLIIDSAGLQNNIIGFQNVDDGQVHHVAVPAYSNNFATDPTFVYIDGVRPSSGGVSASPAWPGRFDAGVAIGNTPNVDFGDFGFDGTIDELCIWDGVALSADRIAAHALAAKYGWEGDDTGTRVMRFLDAIGWSADMRNVDTGISILGPASWSAGASALSVLQAWADTELGAFFMGKSGELVWRSRHYPLLDLRATRPQATFGDEHSGEVLKYDNNGLDMPRDETQIRNPVTASRTNGVTVTVRDDDLADNVYGDRSWAMPGSEDQKDSVVRDRATWGLNRFKEEATRLARMKITPQRDPNNLWPVVLGLELGDRIRVKRTPAGLDAEITLDFIIESIEHKFSPKTLWETTFSGSPVDPNVGSYLILDDAAYGLLDSGLLAY